MAVLTNRHIWRGYEAGEGEMLSIYEKIISGEIRKFEGIIYLVHRSFSTIIKNTWLTELNRDSVENKDKIHHTPENSKGGIKRLKKRGIREIGWNKSD